MNPFFSIIIPNYNKAEYLKECIDSVLEQTFTSFEMIVVDDGSTDASIEILKEYQSRNDPRIKIIMQPNSGLPSIARNNGIKAASAEWICFLDSDDFWYPEKLKKTHEAILKSNGDVALLAHWEKVFNIREPAGISKFRNVTDRNQYEDLLMNGNYISTSTVTARKDLLVKLGGFKEVREYFIVEDYDMWLRLAALGKIIMIEEVLAGYRVFPGNISKNTLLLYQNLKAVYAKHIEGLKYSEEKKQKIKNNLFSKADYYIGRTFQLEGNKKEATKYLLASIRSYPFDAKKYASLVLNFIK